ncbi:MAG: putative substrate-binding transport lipoprotein [Acidimicrobiaceae bacterium]|nr:putative substrate-binding transport lipoprotein [Acidimicrobiaceae bacterium]
MARITNDRPRAWRRVATTVAAGAILSTAAAVALPSAGAAHVAKPSQSHAAKPVALTLWSWDSFATPEVKMFEKLHPNVRINVVNAGTGLAEYTKLRTAIQAGSGVPDLIDMEFPEMRTFEATNSLLDLSKYGANAVANQFVPWVWSQTSANGQVYGIPLATGQMAMIYRADIFKKYGIPIPTTWAQFATDAAKLRTADPGGYLTDIASNDYNAFMGLAEQAGATPFIPAGKNSWNINLNSTAMQKLVSYWGPLIANKTVSTDADFTTAWYQGMSSGKYATWISASWAPSFLEGIAKNTSGEWRVAVLPQWTAGASVGGNIGGGAYVASKTTKYPQIATEFLEFMSTNPQSAAYLALQEFRFPTTKVEAASPTFLQQKVPFFGGQEVNRLFAKVDNSVNKNFAWSPFNDFVASSFLTTVGVAMGNKQSNLKPSLQAWQSAVVSYGRRQGFTVGTK